MSTTMTIRLDDDVKDRLEGLAEATHRSKSFLAPEAVRAYVENDEWPIDEIRAALKEADAGDFASDRQVAALARKWKVDARRMAAQGPAQPRRRSRLHRHGRLPPPDSSLARPRCRGAVERATRAGPPGRVPGTRRTRGAEDAPPRALSGAWPDRADSSRVRGGCRSASRFPPPTLRFLTPSRPASFASASPRSRAACSMTRARHNNPHEPLLICSAPARFALARHPCP